MIIKNLLDFSRSRDQRLPRSFLPSPRGKTLGTRLAYYQNKRFLPLSSILAAETHDMHLLHEKSQLTLYRKSWVFSGYTPLTGWVGTSPTSWPFHRSCTPWSDMSHKVAVIGALRKRLTRSGWDASFLIQLCFQLQVRMISTPIQYMLGRGDKWPHVHIFTETIFEWIRSMDVLCL